MNIKERNRLGDSWNLVMLAHVLLLAIIPFTFVLAWHFSGSCIQFFSWIIWRVYFASRKLTELDIQDSVTVDVGGGWLSCFPENFASLEILNFASLNSEVSFDALERLVSRCRSLRVLKVNESITLEQLQRLLVHAPQLMGLGTGSFMQELTPSQYADIERAFRNCKNLQVLSGLWDATALYLPIIYGACAGLTFLNLSEADLQSGELAKLLAHCPNLRRLWVRNW